MSKQFVVEKIRVTTRSTPRSARHYGGTSSEGKGYKNGWIVEGPWDLVPRYERTGCVWGTKRDAQESADRLNKKAEQGGER